MFRVAAIDLVAREACALAALQSGRAYVNVHTRRNPAGEVRGQIAAARLTIATG
jgi:hypothetical protein